MLGINLAKIREDKGYSLELLSTKSKLDISLVSQIEKGELNPSLKQITKLAVALEVPVHILFSTKSE